METVTGSVQIPMTLKNLACGEKMRKIVLSEPIDAAGIKILENRAEVVVSPDPSEETVGRLMQDADALIVRTATQVTGRMIENAQRLKVISRTGGGLNNVDVDTATACGVVVCGVKGPQDRFVAEHAVAMMGALAKAFYYLDPKTRQGLFKSRFEYLPIGLAGKRVGLIGLGRIGRIVADICINGFQMKVRAYDPYFDRQLAEDSGIVLTTDLKDVLRRADFVSLHVPLTAETRGMIDADALRCMKKEAFLINTSRGEIIKEADLVDALTSGMIAGAGLDVYENEPPAAVNPLLQLANVILTPHSAALTKDTVARLAEGAAQNALDVTEGRKPTYSPNWETLHGKALNP